MKNNDKNYFKPRANDDTGMRTAIWGQSGWLFLHSIAQNYPWKPSQEQIENYYNFFVLVGNVLPCRYCRESYQDFIKQRGTLLNLNTMRNRKSVVTWLYKIHNKVNKKLDVKDHPTLKQVWDKYESFRSVCHKTPKHIKKKGCTVPLNGVRKKCVISFVAEKINEKNKINPINKMKYKMKYKKSLFGKGDHNVVMQNVDQAANFLDVQELFNCSEIRQKYKSRIRDLREEIRSTDLAYGILQHNCNTKWLNVDGNEQFKVFNHFGKKTRPKPPRPPPPETYFTNEEPAEEPPIDVSAKSVSNAFSVLGLTNHATVNLIKRRYRELSLIYHPDRKGGDEDLFKEINNAYAVLMEYTRLTNTRRRKARFGKVVNKRKSIKLVSIKRSTNTGKKLMATFEIGTRKKIIHFGAAGMSDYTKHKDRDRRNKYIFRHNKDLGTGDPTRAGFLSMFVLWNKPSLQASIADYKRRLNVYNRTGKFPKNMNGYNSPGKTSKYQ